MRPESGDDGMDFNCCGVECRMCVSILLLITWSRHNPACLATGLQLSVSLSIPGRSGWAGAGLGCTGRMMESQAGQGQGF